MPASFSSKQGCITSGSGGFGKMKLPVGQAIGGSCAPQA